MFRKVARVSTLASVDCMVGLILTATGWGGCNVSKRPMQMVSPENSYPAFMTQNEPLNIYYEHTAFFFFFLRTYKDLLPQLSCSGLKILAVTSFMALVKKEIL